MAKLNCDLCLPDIGAYYDMSTQIVDINTKLINLASDSALGSKSLGQGRVVILRDDVRYRNYPSSK